MSAESNEAAAARDDWARFWKILLVEDDPVVAKTVKAVLAKGGYEAEVVSSAAEALAAFEPGKFGLIITNHEMSGMKGNALAFVIKARAPNQPILLLKGEGELKQQGGVVAADLIARKPFGEAELLCMVQELMAKGSGGGVEGSVR